MGKHGIRYKAFFLYYIAASFILSAAFVFQEIFTGELGQAAAAYDRDAIVRFLLFFTGIMGIRAVFSALNVLFLRRFTGRVGERFRTAFVRVFLRRPFAQVEKTNSGEHLSLFTSDLPQAVGFVGEHILQLLEGFTLVVAALIFLFYTHWLYTLIFLAAFPLIVGLQAVLSMPVGKASQVEQERRAAFNAVVNDSLQNIATIIAYDLEATMEARYVAAYQRFYTAALRRIRLLAVLLIGGGVISFLPLIFLYIAAAFAVVGEDLTIAEFIAYTNIGMLAAGWLAGLGGSFSSIQTGMAGAKRLEEALDGEPEAIGEKESLDTDSKTAVSFENVSFAYSQDGATVLHDATFTITRGERVAFAGGSGSGKSTILKLLLGLYAPVSGTVCVLGKDTAAIDTYALREAFAYVPQDSFLFPVSIGENITGKVNPTYDEQLKRDKACRDAGIYEFIQSLPDGFASVLSESAENISGGQRQRIAMARAFYKDAPIILFDEATSALDPTTEAEILQTLDTATINKTVIMVAHRASAKAFCDRVITLEGGKIQ